MGAVTRAATGIYRGASAEQRREERRRRLLDAALDIIGTQGWAATTVRGVCEQARVGPRFFYESFPDLDALAAALHDEIVETALRRTLDALAESPKDLATQIRTGTRTIITSFTDDPRRARVVFAEAHASESLMQRRFAAMRTIADVVLVQAERQLKPPPESHVIVQGFSLLLTGGVAEMILVWLDGGLDISHDELIELCVQFLQTFADTLPAMTSRITERP